MVYIAYGIFNDKNNLTKRVGAKVGDKIIDLAKLYVNPSVFEDIKLQALMYNDDIYSTYISSSLNKFIKHYKYDGSIKAKIIEFMAKSHRSDDYINCRDSKIVYALDEIELHLPIEVAGYTDFYCSLSHATNIGKLFRPDNPLLPNWRHLPIGYNGRASSIVVSGYPLLRPKGQVFNVELNKPEHIACKKLDFEVELGVVIGKGNNLGEPIAVMDAPNYIFGVCILNDWSARDIQSWEYQPLGPFNSKGFLTSISPWIIPIEELAEFKTKLPQQQPMPLDYLYWENDYLYDINFEVSLATKNYSQGSIISKTNFNTMYWSINQWIAHHTVTGTALKVGDILGSGTISGDIKYSYGSLMELTSNGKEPIVLPNNETRTFLEDEDELSIRAYCGSDKRLDFGYVSSKVKPSI